jgi:large subunit ribosomal protein L46
MPFKPASRITEADEKNDRRSMERRLQDSLFLIVKRNRTDHSWQFPQGKLLDLPPMETTTPTSSTTTVEANSETLRAAAERVLTRAVGKTKKWFVGNAPIGHFQYAYPLSVQQKRHHYGAKVFYYRAQWLAGNIKLNTKLYTDYAWIARDEVHEYFDTETANYLKVLLPY